MLFAAQGARDLIDLLRVVRDEARRELRANSGVDFVFQRGVERYARAQHHKEWHEALAAQVFQIHRHAVQHFGQCLHGGVNLTRAHAQASAVDRGIASAVYDATAIRANFEPIAMPPHQAFFSFGVCGAVHIEVARQVSRVARIVPKIQWHGRNRLRADQLAYFTVHGPAVFIPSCNCAAEQAALHLAGNLRQLTVASDECAAKIRAARDVDDENVLRANLCKCVAHPALHIFGKWRAGGTQRSDLL